MYLTIISLIINLPTIHIIPIIIPMIDKTKAPVILTFNYFLKLRHSRSLIMLDKRIYIPIINDTNSFKKLTLIIKNIV